jgi:hypothetical protein
MSGPQGSPVNLNPPFFILRKYLTSTLLKTMVGLGSLIILLKIEGAKEIGDFPYN